jgi:hypothetical protein
MALPSVGLEVLTAVVMRTSPFWNITLWSPLKSTDASEEHDVSIFSVDQSFTCYLFYAGFLLGSCYYHEVPKIKFLFKNQNGAQPSIKFLHITYVSHYSQFVSPESI